MTETSGSRAAPPRAAARPAFYLAPHPATPCEAVRSIAVQVERRADGALELIYTIEADSPRIRLPEPAAPRRADGLWRHTCCEAFIAMESGASALDRAEGSRPEGSLTGHYLELNFSPSGEWAAYAFDGYRSGMRPLEPMAAPLITVERDVSGGRWSLRATVPAGSLASTRARLALAAVIEDSEGELGYWALRHPPGRPDFHHPGGFAATL